MEDTESSLLFGCMLIMVAAVVAWKILFMAWRFLCFLKVLLEKLISVVINFGCMLIMAASVVLAWRFLCLSKVFLEKLISVLINFRCILILFMAWTLCFSMVLLQKLISVLINNGTIKIMSYNIYPNSDIMLYERMEAIGELIRRHSPDIILLQEVTPDIHNFFRSCNWWGIYTCSVQPEKLPGDYFCMLLSKLPVKRFFYKHFENAKSSKGLSVAKITTGSSNTLMIANCHLKCHTPGNANIAERLSQAEEALDLLRSSSPNVVLGGDMNWDDDVDGPFPLIGGWRDAWPTLRPDENGYTYDTESNGMINHSRRLQKRLDRFICRLNHFKMTSIEIIGTEAIPGVSYKSKGKELPVLPSDHYGLILTII